MNRKTKAMSASSNAGTDLATLRDDLAVLKRDLAVLIDHVKIGAANGTQAAAARIDGNARDALRGIAAISERGLKAVGDRVEKRPVATLLIVMALGLVGGRLLSR
jgi:hypothetical protein